MAQAAASLEDLLLEKWETTPPPISVKVEPVYDELEEIFRSAVVTPKRKAVGDVLVPVVSKKRRDHPRRSSAHYPDTLNTQKRIDYPNGEFMVMFGGFVFHELLQYIKQATLVVGCLYSATHHQFFEALSKRKGVKLVMHKSDWAYADANSDHRNDQREGLRTLPPLPMDVGVVDPDPRNAAVCVGESQMDNPRKDACLMHRKFLVFLNEENEYKTVEQNNAVVSRTLIKRTLVPYAVWTGTLNLTYSGQESLNDGRYEHCAAPARVMYDEFLKMLAIAEPVPAFQPT